MSLSESSPGRSRPSPASFPYPWPCPYPSHCTRPFPCAAGQTTPSRYPSHWRVSPAGAGQTTLCRGITSSRPSRTPSIWGSHTHRPAPTRPRTHAWSHSAAWRGPVSGARHTRRAPTPRMSWIRAANAPGAAPGEAGWGRPGAWGPGASASPVMRRRLTRPRGCRGTRDAARATGGAGGAGGGDARGRLPPPLRVPRCPAPPAGLAASGGAGLEAAGSIRLAVRHGPGRARGGARGAQLRETRPHPGEPTPAPWQYKLHLIV